MPSVEGLRENRIEEVIPYAVGIHVGLLRAGKRQDCSGQALEAEIFELFRDGFFSRQRLIIGFKRARHMGA